MNDKPGDLPTATLIRRLAAIFYDSMLLLALYMFITALLLPLTGGESIGGRMLPWYRALLLLFGLGFFAFFWRKGGQTLGMRAWRLQVRGECGALGWKEAWLRSVCALLSWLPLGLGFLWSLVDRNRMTWHDRLTRTRLIVIPKDRRVGPGG